MPNLKMSTPRAWNGFAVYANSGKTVEVNIGRAYLLFYEGKPVAVRDQGVCYYPDSGLAGSQIRAVNKFCGNALLQRTEVSNFDFVLAQTLITVAMPWLKRPEAS